VSEPSEEDVLIFRVQSQSNRTFSTGLSTSLSHNPVSIYIIL
jgi:hypothetical protein